MRENQDYKGVPRTENFGDFIKADHLVLSERCESRNNHRDAVVVQDLATKWIQSYPCKTKTSQETERSLGKFLDPSEKSLKQRIPWSLASPVKNYHGIIVHQRLTDPRQMVLLNKRYARRNGGTSAVLLQSGLDEKWWADSMERYCYLRKIQDLLSDGKPPHARRFLTPKMVNISYSQSQMEQ